MEALDGDWQLQTALSWVARERPELGLALQPVSEDSLLEIASETERLDEWLRDTASIAEGVDAKTSAAYLISIFVWRFDEILATLFLRGAPLPKLSADDVDVSMAVGGSGVSRDIVFRFHLSPRGSGRSFDLSMFRQSIEEIHCPLVDALHVRTRLSKTALWRLVSDGVSGGLLAYGKRAQCVDEAMSAAREVIGSEKPLGNPQWRFVEISSPTHPGEWFRLRGGCCRLYKTIGGSLCSTCVLEKSEEQMRRLQRLVLSRPRA